MAARPVATVAESKLSPMRVVPASDTFQSDVSELTQCVVAHHSAHSSSHSKMVVLTVTESSHRLSEMARSNDRLSCRSSWAQAPPASNIQPAQMPAKKRAITRLCPSLFFRLLCRLRRL